MTMKPNTELDTMMFFDDALEGCLLYTSTGAIASQKKDYRFKIGTIGEKKPQDWIVVEERHEPLINSKSFAIVQDKRCV